MDCNEDKQKCKRLFRVFIDSNFYVHGKKWHGPHLCTYKHLAQGSSNSIIHASWVKVFKAGQTQANENYWHNNNKQHVYTITSSQQKSSHDSLHCLALLNKATSKCKKGMLLTLKSSCISSQSSCTKFISPNSGSICSLSSVEKGTLACGSHAQWYGSATRSHQHLADSTVTLSCTCAFMCACVSTLTRRRTHTYTHARAHAHTQTHITGACHQHQCRLHNHTVSHTHTHTPHTHTHISQSTSPTHTNPFSL